MRKNRRFHAREVSGSVLLSALLAMAILSLIAANVLKTITWRFGTVYQAAAWQQSLFTAESGVDIGLEAIRDSLTEPTGAWAGWTTGETGRRYGPYTLSTSTGGVGITRFTVEVDAPAGLVDGAGDQLYRIKAVGVTEMESTAQLAAREENALRRFSFIRNIKSHEPVTRPEVTRTLEVIAIPNRTFAEAVMAEDLISMTSANVRIDSYDSSDPEKSTGGIYDPNKSQTNGDVSTNGQLIDAGGAQIFGNVSTNGGTVKGSTNITGSIFDDFWRDLPPVEMPTSITTNTTLLPLINKTTTLSNSSATTVGRYFVPQISLKGKSILTFAAGPGGASRKYEVLVSSTMTVGGTAEIIIEKGASVVFYVADDIDIGGGGITNVSRNPLVLAINSTKPATNYVPQVKIHGTAGFYGTFYGPTADVTIAGGGTSSSDIYGALVGKSIRFNGNVSLHYDEQLARSGPISDYLIASWFEDTR